MGVQSPFSRSLNPQEHSEPRCQIGSDFPPNLATLATGNTDSEPPGLRWSGAQSVENVDLPPPERYWLSRRCRVSGKRKKKCTISVACLAPRRRRVSEPGHDASARGPRNASAISLIDQGVLSPVTLCVWGGMYTHTGLMVLYHRGIMVWVKTGVAHYSDYGSADVPGSINSVMRYTGDHPLLLHTRL